MKLSNVNYDLARTITSNRAKLNVTMGGDPEYFIGNKHNKILNADAFLPGKTNPLEIGGLLNHPNKIFFDGIQGEMSFGHSTCREFVIYNIRKCLNKLYDIIKDDHKIILKPSVRVQKRIIENADPEARRFGCAPDFNAYTRTTNTPEMDASNHPYRYAGGHIHLGIKGIEFMDPNSKLARLALSPEGQLRIIKLLDLIVGIPTLQLDNGPNAKRRRSKYGKAGCFRPTPYGVEYRTLSCWWLKSPLTVSLVYGLARLAWSLALYDLDVAIMKELKLDEDTIRGCIDESDTKTAKAIWKKLRPYIAISGTPGYNPLHVGTVKSNSYFRVASFYKGLTKLPKIKGDKYVYNLAVFEYMLKNGLHSVVGKDVKDEWCLTGDVDDNVRYYNGMLTCSFDKLHDDKDFMKFQELFLSSIYK